eukprot:s1141_g11.t1
MGLPLKAALEIFGSQNLSGNSMEKNWKFGELRMSGRIILKAKTDIEMGICKVFVHKDLFELVMNGWSAAWEKAITAPQSTKSSSKSSGKGGQEERKIRVPFEIKLVKFSEHPEDAKSEEEGGNNE